VNLTGDRVRVAGTGVGDEVVGVGGVAAENVRQGKGRVVRCRMFGSPPPASLMTRLTTSMTLTQKGWAWPSGQSTCAATKISPVFGRWPT
jgi:hypothetical protein